MLNEELYEFYILKFHEYSERFNIDNWIEVCFNDYFRNSKIFLNSYIDADVKSFDLLKIKGNKFIKFYDLELAKVVCDYFNDKYLPREVEIFGYKGICINVK